jgi:beta-1,4-mannosyl-glycoprotein beta-1,4-N-acetylglucosaminyltransferase
MTVYNSCNFFNELDLLEIRLEMLDSLTDYFIICEGTKTHSGKPKPLYYQENKDRYKKFQDKIIHVVIDDSPNTYQDLLNMKPKNDLHAKMIQYIKNLPWYDTNAEISFVRDGYEKECQVFGLENASLDDIVVIGDLDEFPRPEVLKSVLDKFDPTENYLFKQGSYHFFVNLEKTNEEWVGTNVLTVKNLLSNSIASFKGHQNVIGKRVENGGWHFSYAGGRDAVIKKLESFSHQEFNIDYIKNNVDYIINNCTNLGVDLLGRPSKWAIRNINDGTFPEYLVENQEKFAKYILR